MEPKIQIINLHKTLKEKKILEGVTLDIREGEILCIIGKSGSGKSVLLKHLIGIFTPDDGEIIVDRVPYTGAAQKTRLSIESRMGILFQGAALFDSMNIYDNIAFGLRRKGVDEAEIGRTIPEMLRQVGLSDVEAKMPSELSGGMQKRAGLARSIALKPEIMLYDEPTTGVDPITGGAVDRLIVKMRDTFRITSIVVTHDMNSVYRIADRVAMLYNGKIIFHGTPDEIRTSVDPYIEQLREGKAHGPIGIS